jgi:hypothetical protein
MQDAPYRRRFAIKLPGKVRRGNAENSKNSEARNSGERMRTAIRGLSLCPEIQHILLEMTFGDGASVDYGCN